MLSVFNLIHQIAWKNVIDPEAVSASVSQRVQRLLFIRELICRVTGSTSLLKDLQYGMSYCLLRESRYREWSRPLQRGGGQGRYAAGISEI